MKILLIEDSEEKSSVITSFIVENYSEYFPKIERACNLVEARRAILGKSYDLLIFDFFLPNSVEDKATSDVSSELIEEFSNSLNYEVEAIAITQFDTRALKNATKFSSHDVSVVHFEKEGQKWKRALEKKISKINRKVKFDFLIFCALQCERSAYSKADCELTELDVIKGLDCQRISIGGLKGLCIVPPQMGLVSMGIVVAKAIDYFQPKIVAMSGICAGVKNEVEMLDLIIGDPVWDYSVGKLTNQEFRQEPYQWRLGSDIKTFVTQQLEKGQILKNIKQDEYLTELKNSSAKIAPLSSGPYVVANQSKVDEIKGDHRKVAGIEMEMSSFYQAAFQSMCSPQYFGAKSVVDLGDEDKNDDFHIVGCILSARFVVSILQDYRC